MILDNYQDFLQKILDQLNELGIDISSYEMDHIGYLASSPENYEELLPEFHKLGKLAQEVIVGGVRVAIFEFKEKLNYKGYEISAIELVEPKPDQQPPSALEHVEFVIKETSEEFLQKYPDVNFDSSAMHRPEFPVIKLKLKDGLQAKFHGQPVLEYLKSSQCHPKSIEGSNP